jgi:hypothetical protein
MPVLLLFVQASAVPFFPSGETSTLSGDFRIPRSACAGMMNAACGEAVKCPREDGHLVGQRTRGTASPRYTGRFDSHLLAYSLQIK